MGDWKKVCSTLFNIVSAIYKTGQALWSALSPIWDVISSVWTVIEPIYDMLSRAWEWISGAYTFIWTNLIEPIWNFVEPMVDALDKVITWVDQIYTATIGRIEQVYDMLFGKFEALWGRIEDFGDRLSRVVAIFNEEYAKKIQDFFDKTEAQMIGRVRDLKDELLNEVDKLYTYINDHTKEVYYAVHDLVDPIRAGHQAMQDLLQISFEAGNLLSKDTVVTTADTYGAEWWASIDGKATKGAIEKTVSVKMYSETAKALDLQLGQLDQGLYGDFADLALSIDRNTEALDLQADPFPIIIQETLLPESEIGFHRQIEKEME